MWMLNFLPDSPQLHPSTVLPWLIGLTEQVRMPLGDLEDGNGWKKKTSDIKENYDFKEGHRNVSVLTLLLQ
jgi:hypothetical protein